MRSRSLISTTVLLIGIFSLYLVCAPHNVQELDSGELVTNSFLLRVSHPPGYPLFHWLYHLFANLFNFGTVFFRASLLTSMISIAALSIPLIGIKKNRMIGLLTTCCLATTGIFWKYSIIPDVFALHMLLVFAISYLYLFVEKLDHKQILGAYLLFALGVAHHHTIIFLAPLLIDISWKKLSLKRFIFFGIVSLLTSLLFYLSMFLFDSKAITSFGDLSSLKGLYFHFMRKTYGSFSLTATAVNKTYLLQIFLDFVQTSKVSIISIGALLLLVIKAPSIKPLYKNRKSLIYFSCFITYCLVFFYLAKLEPVGINRTVLARFYLMPLAMLFFLTIYSANQISMDNKSKKLKVLIYLLLIGSIATNIYHNFKENNLSNSTVIEDWAKNRLNLTEKPNTILIARSDTSYFSLIYVQNILKIKPDTLIIYRSLPKTEVYRKKLLQKYPDLKFDFSYYRKEKKYDFVKSIVVPNIDRYSFNIPNSIDIDHEKFHVTFLGLGKHVEKGRGVTFSSHSFSKLSFGTSTLSINNLDYYSHAYDLYAEYAYYFLAKGSIEYFSGEYAKAKDSFKQALQVVPYCAPAYNRICQIELMNQTNKYTERCEKLTSSLFPTIAEQYFD